MLTGQDSEQWRELGGKVAFLSQATSYLEHPETVETIETHMSWVFLTEHFAYKLKKPVRLLALDYSTVELRRQCITGEMALNQALAPTVYLGMLALTEDDYGQLHLGFDRQDARIVDWLLKMRRLPRELMLDQAIGRNGVYQQRLAEAAQLLCEFYKRTERIQISPEDYCQSLMDKIIQNHEALSAPQYRADAIAFKKLVALDDGLALERVRNTQLEFVENNPDLFEQRILDGRIVNGHGDLRPEHICLSSPPVIIDRFEADPSVRMVDIIDELSFLNMECEMLGFPSGAKVFFDIYQQHSDDLWPEKLLTFYRSLRASTRAKFSVWHLDDPQVINKEKWLQKTSAYLELAKIILK